MFKSASMLVGALLLAGWLAFRVDPPLSAMQRELLCDVTTLMLIIAALCFVVAELTRNFSQVDKLWSIVPVLYAWVATIKGGMEPRMVLMAGVATVWGIRLTYNFSRHGGYSWKFWSGNEDYRWVQVRKKPGLGNPIIWALFDLGFIALYQNALLLLIALPIVMVHGSGAPDVADYALAALFVGLVVMETLADQQHWNFQADKKRQIKSGTVISGMAADGFISNGLWARSRHPNYFAEQSIWVVFFLFSVVATGHLNWSIVGCLLLIVLFRGSSNLSESLQLQKYPRYADYQRHTPRFIPKIF